MSLECSVTYVPERFNGGGAKARESGVEAIIENGLKDWCALM
jgi:hypothetical protein